MRGGDAAAALKSAPHRLSGEFHNLGQEQFYLESQAAIAYPGEQGQMTVHSSTQNTSEVQAVVAEVLGLRSIRWFASASGWVAVLAARRRRRRCRR